MYSCLCVDIYHPRPSKFFCVMVCTSSELCLHVILNVYEENIMKTQQKLKLRVTNPLWNGVVRKPEMSIHNSEIIKLQIYFAYMKPMRVECVLVDTEG